MVRNLNFYRKNRFVGWQVERCVDDDNIALLVPQQLQQHGSNLSSHDHSIALEYERNKVEILKKMLVEAGISQDQISQALNEELFEKSNTQECVSPCPTVEDEVFDHESFCQDHSQAEFGQNDKQLHSICDAVEQTGFDFISMGELLRKGMLDNVDVNIVANDIMNQFGSVESLVSAFENFLQVQNEYELAVWCMKILQVLIMDKCDDNQISRIIELLRRVLNMAKDCAPTIDLDWINNYLQNFDLFVDVLVRSNDENEDVGLLFCCDESLHSFDSENLTLHWTYDDYYDEGGSIDMDD